MKICKKMLTELMNSLKKSEQGAILGVKDDIVKYYHIDTEGNSKSTKYIYIPDCNSLNIVIQEWLSKGINFVGMIHTHSSNHPLLSKADVEYAKLLCSSFELNEVIMPIIETNYNNKCFVYLVDINGKIKKMYDTYEDTS